MHQILKPNQIVFKIQFSYLEKVEVGHNYLLSLFFLKKKYSKIKMKYYRLYPLRDC